MPYHGNGLSTAAQLRNSQYEPSAPTTPTHHTAAPGCRRRAASTTTPTVRAAPGKMAISRVPTARPAATAASAVDRVPNSPSSRIASAASTSVAVITSLDSWPGFDDATAGNPTTAEAPARPTRPRTRRPMHHAAVSPNATHPRFTSGERKSRWNGIATSVCTTSGLCG